MQEQQLLPRLPHLRCAATPSPARLRASSSGDSPQQQAAEQQPQQDRSELLLHEACSPGCPGAPAAAAVSSSVWPQPPTAAQMARARSTARLASSSGGGGLLHTQTLEVLDLLEQLTDASSGTAGQGRQQHLVGRGEVAAAVGSAAPLSYEALLQLQDVLVVTPQQVLQALPRMHWRADSQQAAAETAGAAAGSSCDEGQRLCAICQCDFETGDLLLELPCRHQFHEPCAERWLGGHSKRCPVCKAVVCG